MKKAQLFHPSRILCPVDFSDLSDLALKYAATGAKAFGADLVVFHAQRFELPPYFTSGQMPDLKHQRQEEKAGAKDFLRLHVRKVLGSAAAGIRIQYDLEDAHPVDAILAAAKRHKAGLIVMGTHGRGGARRIWLGSVLENVIRQAGVPVFAVRQKQHEFIDASNPQHLPTLESILCPVNFSPAAQASLESAVSLARQFNSRLVAACVVEPGDTLNPSERTEKLAAFLQQSGAAACDLQTQTRKGEAGKEIVSLASRTKADLIVLGAQPRHSMHAWLWGDTTEFVLRHAPVPVLVVPAPDKERR
jgi:nucleotide-binding universal stress UspA family protein